MTIQQWSPQIWLVKLGNEPTLSEDLVNALMEVEQSAAMPDLVLDFADVEQLNSTNLSQLLRLRKLAVKRDSKLKLAAIPDSVWAVFLTTGLDKIFEFVPDVSTALAGLRMRQSESDRGQ